MPDCVLALDQGTTSSRAILFDHKGDIVSVAQKEFKQLYPKAGWVEHDPMEIWASQISVATEAVAMAGLKAANIASIGITNQRETTIVWDRETGTPVYNAIVWQDRRTAEYCDKLREKSGEAITSKTGLLADAYFSGSKIAWILDNVEGARKKAEAGKLAFGTVDSWLVWNLTDGQVHATDYTNASRTMLFNIHSLEWDEELLKMMNVPRSMLPEVKPSSGVFGHTAEKLLAARIPVAGIAGDQQAALFGQMCTGKGMVKNTYGTGCFMLMNTGTTPVRSHNKLITTIAWNINGKTEYALEGSIFIGGAVVQWLRDGLGIIQNAPAVEALADSVEDNGGVFLVPAFAGLGSPHWDQYARGTMVGITRGTTSAHIARASLESIALQTADVLKAMEADAGIKLSELRVDGGATANNLLLQIQADVLGVDVVRPRITETTALGAAYLAGLAVGFWKDLDAVKGQWQEERRFSATAPQKKLTDGWKRALAAAKAWSSVSTEPENEP